MIGTILPTKRSIEINNQYAKDLARDKEIIGRRIKGEKKIVGGEVRYMLGDNKYAIVGRGLKIHVFEIREDGDYFIGYKTI